MRSKENIHPKESKEQEDNSINLSFDRKTYDEICELRQSLEKITGQEIEGFKKILDQALSFYKFYLDTVIIPPQQELHITGTTNKQQAQYYVTPKETPKPQLVKKISPPPTEQEPASAYKEISMPYSSTAINTIHELKQILEQATGQKTTGFERLASTALIFYKLYMDTILIPEEQLELHITGGTAQDAEYYTTRKNKPKLRLIKK